MRRTGPRRRLEEIGRCFETARRRTSDRFDDAAPTGRPVSPRSGQPRRAVRVLRNGIAQSGARSQRELARVGALIFIADAASPCPSRGRSSRGDARRLRRSHRSRELRSRSRIACRLPASMGRTSTASPLAPRPASTTPSAASSASHGGRAARVSPLQLFDGFSLTWRCSTCPLAGYADRVPIDWYYAPPAESIP